MIEDFKGEMENEHLIEKYEVSFSTVFKLISKEKSIDEKRYYKRLTLEQKKQPIKDYENGMSKKHLEKNMKCIHRRFPDLSWTKNRFIRSLKI